MNRKNISQLLPISQTKRLLAIVRRFFLLSAVTVLAVFFGPAVAKADFLSGHNIAVDAYVSRHTVTLAQGVQISSVAVQVPVGVTRVALSAGPRWSGNHSALEDGSVLVGSFRIKRNRNAVVLTGWQAIRISPQSMGRANGINGIDGTIPFQKIYLQEIRITLPHSASNGGWDVRSLERELERLGVKVKPKPSLPKPTLSKPTMQLSG